MEEFKKEVLDDFKNRLLKLNEEIIKVEEKSRKKGDKFNTEVLYWNEATQKVYSDKFIRIEQEDKIITGYGFESNQQMTEYQIYNNTGIFTVEDTAPADSTKAVANSTRTDSIR